MASHWRGGCGAVLYDLTKISWTIQVFVVLKKLYSSFYKLYYLYLLTWKTLKNSHDGHYAVTNEGKCSAALVQAIVFKV